MWQSSLFALLVSFAIKNFHLVKESDAIFKIKIVFRMRFTKAVLLLSALIGGGTTAEASAPIQLSRERFANSKAIDLDLEAQTQMAKGDLRAAGQSINEALRIDPTLWLT